MTYSFPESDALELLGYRSWRRKWMEILGYEYSTAGLQAFRSVVHDIETPLLDVILSVIRDAQRFPRVEQSNGMYLRREADGTVVCTERYARDYWRKRTYESESDAALVLIHARCTRPELLPDRKLAEPIAVQTTHKWDRRNHNAP